VRGTLLLSLALAATLVALNGLGAQAATCAYPSTYPGDDAAKAAIAAWMAGAASDAGLPGELPVMAALVDSGLRNLPQEDRTTAGYFQMRVDIWDKGDYAGFPDHPTLQLQWFINQAIAVRQRHVAAGDTNFGADPSSWGEWVADVQRPAEQYRGRYQLKLEDARSLIAAGCATSDPEPSEPTPADPGGGAQAQPPDAQLIADSVLPRIDVRARRFQDAGKSRVLSVSVACPDARCLARAAATVAVPERGVFRMSIAPAQLGRGERHGFRLALSTRVRKLVAAALRKHVCPLAAVRVVAANAGGYRNSASRTIVVGRSARSCS
jgi:hypothetical protein